MLSSTTGMQAADHFRIADFGPICASSLYFDQAPNLSCTCYDEGGPGQCPFHPLESQFVCHIILNGHVKKSCLRMPMHGAEMIWILTLTVV